ncbi:MAG: efflux RND transporter periplasmic adaptor subunit [Ramlibacter sp.]
MKNTRIAIAAMALAGLVAGGYGLFMLGVHEGAADQPKSSSAGASAAPPAGAPQSIAEGEDATRRHIKAGLKAGEMDPATGRRILYYHDPMVPGNKFDKPAKSPFMDMMLVPVYAGGDTDQGNVTVNTRIQQNLGVRTAVASEGNLSTQLSAVGAIAFNERDQVVVQARATGYVERLRVRATLDRVAKGQVLAELYVPEWVAAQEEFLAVRNMQGAALDALVDGARARMRQAGMSDEQIRKVEASGKPDARIAVTAPDGGLVTEVAVREGMTVMPGATLFRINGFSTVWANAEVPESQAAVLRPGAKVRAQTPAAPGVVFEGHVQALLPDVNVTTRTLKARVELANAQGRLVPGMFVSMQFMDMQPQKAILVPTEAVIQTGRRSVVMVAEDNGRFRPVEVQAGIESGGQTEIKSGLQAGQRVVVSSQFLIDSEASLKGVEARLNGAPTPPPTPAPAIAAAPRHEAEAKIEAIARDGITLSHGPIPSLKWGAMTMEFKPPPAKDLPRNLEPGDRVAIEFYMDKEGLPQLTRVSPIPAQPRAQASGSRK